MSEAHSTNQANDIELIFHVGLGKTGSSSIQASLLNGRDRLRDYNIFYLGLMLEHSPIKRYDWQCCSGANLFYQSTNQCDSLFKAIEESLIALRKEGYTKAIISNEWFGGCNFEFSRNQGALEAISRLCAVGHRVTIVAYIRDHISWAVSAYQQWCLKHKSIKGPIIPFMEYSLMRPPEFSDTLISWNNTGAILEVFNYNRLSNVVSHFERKYIDEQNTLEVIQENIQPNDHELYLRSCFNDSVGADREVRPDEFKSHFRRVLATSSTKDYFGWFDSLLPSEKDIAKLHEVLSEDMNQVNILLESHQEEPFSYKSSRNSLNKLSPPKPQDLINYLTEVCLRLASDNLALRKRLRNSHEQK